MFRGENSNSDMHVTYVWRLEENLQKLVLPFYYVGPRNETQVVRLRGECLYLLTKPSYGPQAYLFNVFVVHFKFVGFGF